MPYKDKKKQAASARRHYVSNKSKVKERARRYTDQQRRRLRERIAQVKETSSCAECGVEYPGEPYLFDFHHLRDKETNVGDMVKRGVSMAHLDRELEKCILLCAICHRRETHTLREQALVG